jgi:hypothetical protein
MMVGSPELPGRSCTVGWVEGAVFSGKEPCLDGSLTVPTENSQRDDLRASVVDRFRRVAKAPEQARKFAIGPESARRLSYEPAEVDALPSYGTESFCGSATRSPWAIPGPVRRSSILVAVRASAVDVA